MMEFWLIDINNRQKLRLPVPPPDFKNEGSQSIKIVDINDFGEYSIKGKKQLDRMTIKSFFPSKYYSFCQYRNFPKPYVFTKIIETWKENKHPFRLLITETGINKLFLIERFIYGERAGSRDVDFELDLVEYRPLKSQTVQVSNSYSSPTSRSTSEPAKPKTYTVVSGDTLWEIARKIYNDPNRWKDISSKNGLKDPKKLQAGKVLILP